MARICGWMHRGPGSPGSAQELLRAMLGSDGGHAHAAHRLWREQSAVAGARGLVPVAVHQAGGLLVAVQGRVSWRTPELAALAAGDGAAAAVAELHRRYGEDCLHHVGGNFAIAVLDNDNASALLAVDRMGIRTLCYANPPGELVFGSHAEVVAAHPRVGRRISAQALFNYLYCHVVPSPGSIFEGVCKLQPGECLTLRKGIVERRFYWQLAYADGAGRDSDDLKRRFHSVLREAAARAIDGDEEVGAFLSGGTDSSTVAGLLTELRGRPARTYSIGFAAKGFDEMGYARIAARHFGTRAREYYVTPQDVLDAIPRVARAYDEPFGNASAVPTYFCASMARADGVRVMLAGDGGDEIFGGNARYAWQKLFEAYNVLPPALRSRVLEPLVFRIPAGDRIAPVRKLRSYIAQARVPLPDRLESYNFLQRAPLAEVLEPEFLASVEPLQPLALLREQYRRASSDAAVNRMMHLDLKFTLADNDLRKVSRMCELGGVEARYPLLDDALVEFSGQIPPSLKVKGLKLRYFFKEALREFLPPQTLAKPKHGFGLPFGLWLSEHSGLADLARQSLSDFQRRGVVRAQYTRELLHQHNVRHATYFGVMIWVIMMLERWLAERNL